MSMEMLALALPATYLVGLACAARAVRRDIPWRERLTVVLLWPISRWE